MENAGDHLVSTVRSVVIRARPGQPDLWQTAISGVKTGPDGFDLVDGLLLGWALTEDGYDVRTFDLAEELSWRAEPEGG